MSVSKERENAESLNLKHIPACVALEPPASVGGCSSSEGGELIGEEFCNGLETAQKQNSSFTPCPGTKQALLTKIFVNLDKSNCFHAESFMGRRIQLFMENLNFEKLWMLFEGALCSVANTCWAAVVNFLPIFFVWLRSEYRYIPVPSPLPCSLCELWDGCLVESGAHQQWNSLCESFHTYSVLRATNTCTWKET